MAKKTGKFNAKNVVKRALMVGGTGAVAQVLTTMIEGDVDATTGKKKNAEMVNYGLIAVGLVLPEVVKGDEVAAVADAALAIGAFRTAESLNIAGKLGINGISGANDFRSVGSYGGGWEPKRTQQSAKKDSNSTNSQVTI